MLAAHAGSPSCLGSLAECRLCGRVTGALLLLVTRGGFLCGFASSSVSCPLLLLWGSVCQQRLLAVLGEAVGCRSQACSSGALSSVTAVGWHWESVNWEQRQQRSLLCWTQLQWLQGPAWAWESPAQLSSSLPRAPGRARVPRLQPCRHHLLHSLARRWPLPACPAVRQELRQGRLGAQGVTEGLVLPGRVRAGARAAAVAGDWLLAAEVWPGQVPGS